MITELSIVRDDVEFCVEVNSENTAIGYVSEHVGGFAMDQPIPLTQSEQADAEELLLAKVFSLAKRDIDFTAHDYAPTVAEMDREADRYFENRYRK